MPHYRKIWETYNKQSIPDNFEIHHVDGDNTNNNPNNLICVSIEEHLEIHKSQNDWGAVQAILMRVDNMDGISEAASKFQKQLIKEGKHNWQKMSKEERSDLSKEIMQKRISDGNPAFLGIEDPIENARNAGLIAAERCAGFLDTKSKSHGSKYVKGTKWWTNPKGEHVRRVDKPIGDWSRGMVYN